jgi:hypothetical protein
MGEPVTLTSAVGCRLVIDAERGVWSFDVDGQRVIAEAGIEPVMGGRCVESIGPATCEVAAAEDVLGPVQRATLERILGSGLRVQADLSLLEGEPVVLIDVALSNPAHEGVHVGSLRPAAGFAIDIGAPAERCTVITNDYWFAPRNIVRLDEQPETTEWWSAAVADRTSGRTLVLGIAEAANAAVTCRVRREGTAVLADIDAGLATDREGSPLLIPPGGSFRLCRLVALLAEGVHEALDRYADLIKRNVGHGPRHPAYSGLFTGYSSSPGLETVVRLDEARTISLLRLVKEKLGRYGVDYVKIEFEPCGSPNLLDPEQYRMEDYFATGPRALTDAIRALGFRPALQSRTFTYVRGGDPDEREQTTALYRRFTEDWGFEYLMLDFNETDIANDDPARPLMQVFRDRFRMIREAVGDGVFIEACMIPWGPVVGLADGYRAAHDYRGGNEDTLLGSFATRYHLHGRVFQLDTEYYDVAQRPFVWDARDVVTPLSGARAWVSLCALTGYSFLLGGAIEATSDERFRLATRALPVTGIAARPIDLAERPLPEVWSLCVSRETPTRHTIGLFNWDYEETRTIATDLARCGLPGGRRYAAFDFWAQQFLGEVSEAVDANLVARNARVVWLTEVTDRPEIIGCSRHLTGFFAGRITGWDPESATLQGLVSGHGDPCVSLFIYLPQRWAVGSAAGAGVEQVEQRVVRLDVPTPDGESAWTVVFDTEATVR